MDDKEKIRQLLMELRAMQITMAMLGIRMFTPIPKEPPPQEPQKAMEL